MDGNYSNYKSEFRVNPQFQARIRAPSLVRAERAPKMRVYSTLEGEMDWTNMVDILFHLGGLLAAGFVAYGGWLSLNASGMNPHKTTDEDRLQGTSLATRRHISV